jgi:molecular chaperone DnaK (HSP70)
MSGFGTDIVALACIVGSAATSGAATLALQNREAPASADCSVEALMVSPNVVVSRAHGSHAVVLSTPRIRVRGARDCRTVVGEEIRIDMERVRRDVERAKAQVEEARVRAEGARVRAAEARERVRVIRIREDGAREAEENFRGQLEAAQEEIQAALEQAQKARAEALDRAQEQLEIRLKEVKKGSGGQMD